MLWIAAHEHRRTVGLCREWSIPLCLLLPGHAGWLVWFRRMTAAVAVLLRENPQVLFVANPSLVLTTLASILRPILGYTLVVDAHNEGVRPFDRPTRLVRWLTRRLLRRADITLVSNAALAAEVECQGGSAVVLPDALPRHPRRMQALASDEKSPDVAVIATFRRDEPIAAILEAARSMPDRTFVLTGHASAFTRLGIELPANARLSGYLDDDEYWYLLSVARVVCDLTLKQDCLVCGAYEALALGKAMVLSDNRVTSDVFGPAAVLAAPDADSIARAIAESILAQAHLEERSRILCSEYGVRWKESSAAAWARIVERVNCPPGAGRT